MTMHTRGRPRPARERRGPRSWTARLAAAAMSAACLATAEGAVPAEAMVGGSPAFAGEFPSHAFIQTPSAICGGQLIAPTWVLTAKHCVDKGDAVGTELRINGTTWSNAAVSTRIRQVELHPDARIDTSGLYVTDLALLRVDQVTGVQPIALSTKMDAFDQRLILVGSGGTSSLYRAEFTGSDAIPRSQFQIFSPDAGVCRGDSGSGLIDFDSSPPQLFGILYAGNGCGAGIPGRAMMVSRMRAWIDWVMGPGPADIASEYPAVYLLRNVATNQLISVKDGSVSAGGRVIQRPAGGEPDQYWTFGTSDGKTTIRGRFSAMVVANPGSSTKNAQYMVQWTDYGGSPEQQWYFEPTKDGYHTIRNVSSGKYLAIGEGSTASGAPVIQWPWTGGDEQKWEITSGVTVP